MLEAPARCATTSQILSALIALVLVADAFAVTTHAWDVLS